MDLYSILVPVLILLFIAVIGVYFAYLFNRLNRYSNAAEANLGQIKVAMKKRLDMVEQLLGAVKGYIRYERGVFESIAEMRSKVFTGEAGGLEEVDRDSRSIIGAITAVAEAYPDLKGNETVRKLMEAIISVEDEIARHRYTYNNIVQVFNTMVASIPSNMVAKASGFRDLGYLEYEEEVEKAPTIKGITEG
jgi:LemA protein